MQKVYSIFRYVIILSTLIVVHSSIGQKESASTYPVAVGKERKLTWHHSWYKEVVKGTVIIDSNTYYHVSQVFSGNTIDLLLRDSHDTVYYYNQSLKKEQPLFATIPSPGLTVGDGKITGVNKKLKTPQGKLKGLLEIEIRYPYGHREVRYFQKDVGLVAVKKSNGYVCYLLSD